MSIVADDTSSGMSDDAAVAALMTQMKAAPKGQPEAEEADDEDADPEDQDGNEHLDQDDEGGEPEIDGEDDDDPEAEEGEDEGEEGEEEEEEQAAPAADLSDDATVKVTVDGEETEVTIGSLKRLAGQEASLTRKSQEADQVGGRAAAMIQGALEALQEDLAPYADIDWLVAQQEMEPEEFKWHRDNFARNKGRFDRLVAQAGNFEQTVSARRKASMVEQAKQATVELARDIPGWNDALYGDILQYGIEQGLEADDVANITNAKVIKILHKAMTADRATKAVAQKVKAAPARVKRPSASDEATGSTNSRSQRRLEQKLRTGRATDDDAVALLMGRWKA